MSSPPRALGDYDLGALIGRGGMSEVYEARHRNVGGTVAIKLLRAHLAGDARALEAFAAEAARTRAIVHPNVVAVRDFGHDAGTCYFVMERLDGETLAALLARGALPEARARELGAAIADGLAAAHALGIVHRDLKPGNVMLADDTPKLVDFGIARHVAGDDPLTTGTRIGTPAYMAPEQLAGGLIAPGIDVWALGVVLFEMVTGRLPFDTAGGASPQLVAPAPRLTAPVSASYAALVARCLERDPALRPRAIADLARALRGTATDGERLTEDLGPVPAVRNLPTGPLAPPARSRRWIAPVIAVALLGLGGAIAWRALDDGSAHDASVPSPTPVAPATLTPLPATSGAPAAPVIAPAPAPPRRRPTSTHAVHRGSAVTPPAPRAGETLD